MIELKSSHFLTARKWEDFFEDYLQKLEIVQMLSGHIIIFWH